VATTLTLASGGSGGVFAPSLFLGATTGAAFGLLLEKLGLLPEGGSPAAYALVGMAAVVAGSTHATLTAILILFELTRDVYVLLPIMLAATVATIFASVIERDSIYTFKLRRAGVLLGAARDIVVLRRIPVTSVPIEPLPEEAVFPSDPLAKLITLHAHHNVPDFAVTDADGVYLGMITGRDLRTALIDREAIPLLLVAELLRTDLPTLTPDESLDTVVDKMAETDISSLCLVTGGATPRPIGLITRTRVMARYRQALEES
ncbi:MAG: chloride channel protein, partial [Planctomycetota bacterium]